MTSVASAGRKTIRLKEQSGSHNGKSRWRVLFLDVRRGRIVAGSRGFSGASVGLQKKLISTKIAIAPITMNITYCRMRPVCTPAG